MREPHNSTGWNKRRRRRKEKKLLRTYLYETKGAARESRRKVFIDPREGAQRVCLCTLSRVKKKKKSHNVPHKWEELQAEEGGAIRSCITTASTVDNTLRPCNRHKREKDPHTVGLGPISLLLAAPIWGLEFFIRHRFTFTQNVKENEPSPH